MTIDSWFTGGMMKSINIQIPEDVVLAAKIPRKRLKEEIKRELAFHLYKEGILPLGPARRRGAQLC